MILWRDDVVMARPVLGGAQRHEERSRLYLRVEHDGVIGYGEVSPQPEALHGDPSLDEVVGELGDVAVPRVLEAVAREGAAPSWARINRFAGSRPASATAAALLEMALLDRELREHGRDVASLWPPRFDTPVQATVSLLDDQPWEVPGTAARVRAKTGPAPVSAPALERLAGLAVPVVLDYNCSARSVDDVLVQAESVRAVADLVAVEQPFAPGNLAEQVALARRSPVPLGLDEGLRSLRDLELIARHGAAAMVCVKPARVGGLANARTIIVRAGELGLRCYLGGFFESPFARHVHALLARHCVREPSDLADVALTRSGEQLEAATASFGVAPAAALLERAQRVAAWQSSA
jgi:o-succinylbenzoate synthase